jgi:hypothetical protein
VSDPRAYLSVGSRRRTTVLPCSDLQPQRLPVHLIRVPSGSPRSSRSSSAVGSRSALDHSCSTPRDPIDLARTWRRATVATGQAGLLLHDLRASFLRLALAAGVALPVAADLIGLAAPRSWSFHAAAIDEDTRTDALSRVNAFIDLGGEGGRP